MWVGNGVEWIEIRSTKPGVTEVLEGYTRPTATDAPRHEGVYSFVTRGAEAGERVRSLPLLYLNTAPLFADRDENRVVERLSYEAATATEYPHKSIYAVHACRLNGNIGLYSRDVYNRAAFRRKLQRAGLEFSREPYVAFTSSGAFECSDWGRFEPTFMIIVGRAEDPNEVAVTRGAFLPFSLAQYRFGLPSPAELSALVDVVRDVPGWAATEPAPLINAISSLSSKRR